MRYGIVIPSKARPYRLAQTLPHWLTHDLPVHIIVEREDAEPYRSALRELGLGGEASLHVLKRSNRGTGFARGAAVMLANINHYDAFIMCDDDAHCRDEDNVRGILEPVGRGFAFAVGGWTSQYGNWLPLGNEFGKEPGKLVPMNLSTDRLYALNPRLAARVGNFNSRLKVKENIALQLEAIAQLNLFWYAGTSVHIVNVGKRYDPGGISAHANGGKEEVEALERRDHRIIHERWGRPFISYPDKRMAISWKNFIPHYWSTEALQYLYDRTVTLESEAKRPPNLKRKVVRQ